MLFMIAVGGFIALAAGPASAVLLIPRITVRPTPPTREVVNAKRPSVFRLGKFSVPEVGLTGPTTTFGQNILLSITLEEINAEIILGYIV